MIELKTGPVRMSGYAIKLRRAANAAMRSYYAEKKLDAKIVNEKFTELNKLIYETLINRYNIPKDVIVNIQLSLDVIDNNLIIKDISVDIYDKDELISTNVTKELKQKLGLQ